MQVPLLDMKRAQAAVLAEMGRAAGDVLARGEYILGPNVRAFEQEAAAWLGDTLAVGMSSGTDALQAALIALRRLRGRGRVLTTPFTFVATAEMVLRTGFDLAFVDVEPDTGLMDPAAAARRIGSGDCGLLPVHLFGQCADLDALLGLARSHNAWVLEDAAQAFGAAWRGRKAGTLGAAGCFSFFPSKNLGCAGDGGLVCTADQELAAACVAARSHGSEGQKYRHRFLAGNFRLDELQAAILRVKLPHVDAWNRERQELAGRYDALLSDAGLVASGAVRPLARAAHSTHVFHQYVVRAQGRDRLQAALAAAGVSTAVYYPVPLHVQDAFAEGGARADDCPAALALSREVLALPIFPGLAAGEQQYVVERIAAFFAGQG